MKPTKKARRPAQRTARTLHESLPGIPAFYSDKLAHSMLDGRVQPVPGHTHHVAAFGSIETLTERTERPVAFNTRAVLCVRAVRRARGPERCEVTLLGGDGMTYRIGLDAQCLEVSAAIARARS